MPILSVGEYRTYASIAASDTSLDGPLSFIVPGVCALIERETGRTFASGTYTEYQDGNDSNRIAVKNPPISSITSVAIVNSAQTVLYTYTSTLYTYESDTGTIKLVDSDTEWLYNDEGGTSVWDRQIAYPAFPKGENNIKVVYVGGYSAIPADLKLAACEIVAIRMANRDDPTILSETTGQRSVTRTQPFGGGEQISPAEAAIIERIKRHKRYSWV